MAEHNDDATAGQHAPAWSYQPLQPEHVRWYWFKSPITKGTSCTTLKRRHVHGFAGRPAPPDAPSRGELWRFCDADSLACEAYYRQHQAEVERAWWQQQATLCKKAPATNIGGEGAVEHAPTDDTWEVQRVDVHA